MCSAVCEAQRQCVVRSRDAPPGLLVWVCPHQIAVDDGVQPVVIAQWTQQTLSSRSRTRSQSMMVCSRWAIAMSVELLNSSRTVAWISASVSTSTFAVASSSTMICAHRQHTDALCTHSTVHGHLGFSCPPGVGHRSLAAVLRVPLQRRLPKCMHPLQHAAAYRLPSDDVAVGTLERLIRTHARAASYAAVRS